MDHDTQLSDEQIDRIAEKAANKALEKVYAEVGKTVLKRLAWIVGLVSVSLLIWLAHEGKL